MQSLLLNRPAPFRSPDAPPAIARQSQISNGCAPGAAPLPLPPGVLPSRENKSQIARSLRPRGDEIVQARRDLHFFDAGRRAGLLFSFDAFQNSRFGTGIIITPDASSSRSRSLPGIPSACRTSSSSSKIRSGPNRSAREHSPPIGRGAASSTHGPCSFTRNSACTGPCVRPSARTVAAAQSRDAVVAFHPAVATASRKSSPRNMALPAGRACRKSPECAASRASAILRRPLPRRECIAPRASGRVPASCVT